MADQHTFLSKARAHDLPWLQAEIEQRVSLLRSLRFDLAFGTVSALKALRTAKRELAQLQTISTEKQRAAATEPSGVPRGAPPSKGRSS
ncbi:50S ribosomal protein L29 [Candidatus Berkelbacteria bacterium]|nr:50S ribosomal protein L29 [Candidatus Berkelbacteria bacterium]